MPTSPQRRTRIRQAHQLRQQGRTLRQIAHQLGVAHSTIADDLKLLETQRNELTAGIAHDLLLEHALQLRDRVLKLRNQDPLHSLQRFPIVDEFGRKKTRASEATAGEIARFYTLHERALNHAEREYRYALQELAHANIQIDAERPRLPRRPTRRPRTPRAIRAAQPTRTTPNNPEQIRTSPDHPRPRNTHPTR